MRRRAAALATALLATACASGALVRHGEINADALAEVRRRLPAVRGLAFTAPVPATALDPAKLRAFLAQDLATSYPGDALERLTRVYERLGLLPPDTPLRAAFLALFEREGAGFYDPRTKQLVLSTEAHRNAGVLAGFWSAVTGRDLVGEFLVAHELTHALQDQHWGLPTAPAPPLAGQGDRLLARRALIEGDATLAGFAYLLHGHLDHATVARAESAIARTPAEMADRHPDSPAALRATLAFPYDRGTAFVARAHRAGGWEAVDALHADPPGSTEQILHPERYDTPRDDPLEVTLAGTAALEAAGWTPLLEDTLGEFQVRVLAETELAPADAARVAAGWGGDRLRALARGEDLALVWLTLWDTPADANEFVAAVPRVVHDARTEQRGAAVLVLAAPAEQQDALAAAVWHAATWTRDGTQPSMRTAFSPGEGP